MAARLSPSPFFTRRVHVLPSKTLLRLLKPTNKRPSTTTVVASIRHNNNIVSLTATATTHLLKPPPNPATFLHVSAFLFLVSAAVYGVLHLGHLRRRLVTSSSPHLHRPIAPPSRSSSEWEGRVKRKQEFQLILSRGSYRSYDVGRRKSGDLARIELLVIGELVLRNGVARARLSSSFVDVPMETMIIDVISGSGDACSDSNRSDPSFGSGMLLLPEISTNSSVDLLASNEEKIYHNSELQRSIPAIVMVAGTMGAFAGGEIGGLEMVGFLALLSFFAYDLLWANKRKMLWSELLRINDREGFMSFLLSKRIVV